MIVRKPYAFLIRSFKLIHFFMLIFSSYILYKSDRLFNLFKNYVDTRQILDTGNLLNEYIPILLFVFSILIIAFSVIIFILLKQKDKPKLLYILMIAYYAIFIVFLIISSSTINTILLKGISPKNARIIRDISLIILMIQIVFVVLILIRTLGFDIRKFHFGEDLQSLKIDVTDNEEIELTTGIDRDKLLIKLKMQKEEWKAFFLENKVIIIMILVLLLVVIPSTFIIRSKIENKRYEEKERIDLDNLDFKVKDTYITKYNYKGDKLLKGTNSYIIVNFNIANLSKVEKGINLNNLRIEVNDKVYSSTTTEYSYFMDLGVGYYEQKIKADTSKDYIAVYIVDDKDLTDNIVLRYTDKIVYDKSESNTIYKRINLKPKSIDNIETQEPVVLNETINFDNSMLKKTNLNITSYGIKNYYTYNYNNKQNYIINENGLVLKLSYAFNIDSSINYINDFKEFITTYGQIIYTYNNNEYKLKVNDITPNAYKEQDLYILVDNSINSATNIKILFTVRNIKYIYVLK